MCLQTFRDKQASIRYEPLFCQKERTPAGNSNNPAAPSTATGEKELMNATLVAAATLTLIFGQATAFVPANGRQRPLGGSKPGVVTAARLSACNNLTFASKRHSRGQAHQEYYSYCHGRGRSRLHQRAHKTSDAEPSTVGKVDSDEPADGISFLDELLERCTDATRSDGAIESSHTGSSEWAGFKTTPELLEVSASGMTACAIAHWAVGNAAVVVIHD